LVAVQFELIAEKRFQPPDQEKSQPRQPISPEYIFFRHAEGVRGSRFLAHLRRAVCSFRRVPVVSLRFTTG
jgi:hypothetical protein